MNGYSLLQDVSKEYLNPSMEREVLKKAKKGDKQAVARLVQVNIDRIYKRGTAYTPYGVDMDDLIQAGALGILKAIKKFDLSQNTSFGTVAHWYITKEMRMLMLTKDSAINYTMAEAKRNLNKLLEKEQLPDIDLAKKLNVSMAKLKELKSMESTLSLNQEIRYSKGKEPIQYIDTLKYIEKGYKEIENSLSNEGFLDTLKKHTSEREFDIVTNYFGVYTDKKISMAEAGLRWGISKQRVRQILDEVFDRVKGHENFKKWREIYVSEHKKTV